MSDTTPPRDGVLGDELLGEAIAAYHPPRSYDPEDITTWTAGQLDELAVLAVDGLEGFEVDWIGAGQENAPHGVNTAGEQV